MTNLLLLSISSSPVSIPPTVWSSFILWVDARGVRRRLNRSSSACPPQCIMVLRAAIRWQTGISEGGCPCYIIQHLLASLTAKNTSRIWTSIWYRPCCRHWHACAAPKLTHRWFHPAQRRFSHVRGTGEQLEQQGEGTSSVCDTRIGPSGLEIRELKFCCEWSQPLMTTISGCYATQS